MKTTWKEVSRLRDSDRSYRIHKDNPTWVIELEVMMRPGQCLLRKAATALCSSPLQYGVQDLLTDAPEPSQVEVLTVVPAVVPTRGMTKRKKCITLHQEVYRDWSGH
jgi:hypothetical protein